MFVKFRLYPSGRDVFIKAAEINGIAQKDVRTAIYVKGDALPYEVYEGATEVVIAVEATIKSEVYV